jgi:hypothetical protein
LVSRTRTAAKAKEPGGEVWVAEAPNWTIDSGSPLKIAIAQDAIKWRAQHGFRQMIGQQYGVLGVVGQFEILVPLTPGS